jgi:hypothetical protein
MTTEDPLAHAQELLNGLPEAPLEQHAEAFETIHRSLSEALTSIDNL